MDYADLGPAMSESHTRELAQKAKDKADMLEVRLARIEAKIDELIARWLD